jgi:gluconate 2-dehydrogenase gamma chain
VKKHNEMHREMSRREFVRVAQSGSIMLILPPGLSVQLLRFTLEADRPASSNPRRGPRGLKRLTDEQAAILESVTARIIPSGDTPGAREAGVVRFIDNMIAAQYAAMVNAYKTGLRRLDDHAVQRYGGHFLNLTDEAKDLIVTEMDQGKIPGWPDCQTFFSLLRLHTIEGMFSDPAYGGNANGVGWKLFAGPDHNQKG